jgi:hypothetical protein
MGGGEGGAILRTFSGQEVVYFARCLVGMYGKVPVVWLAEYVITKSFYRDKIPANQINSTRDSRVIE